MDDEILDAAFEEYGDENLFTEEAKKPGATFRSVFGFAIYEDTKQTLDEMTQLSEKEKSALLPRAFTSAVSRYSNDPAAAQFLNDENRAKIEGSYESATMFFKAFEGYNGREIIRGFKPDAGLLTGHEATEKKRSAPPYIRSQAQQLHETGVCGYVDKIHTYMSEFRDAEKTRAAAHEGRVSVKVKVKSRGMVR